jgi:CubicO group peptidase (beta-lactamase class C family)
MMDAQDLQTMLTETAGKLGVPGAAAAIYQDGAEHYAFHGVTSVENPLPVEEGTLFQFGSTGKTYTATAIMRLVDRGQVDLGAPVRRYVPELRLKDAQAARDVTVLQLLNHTAGWAGDLLDDTGWGDDALAKYVELMADIDQVSPLGEVVSYNNASLSLAGRIIEKVTGQTYEQAMKELVLEPVGLTHSFFFPNDIMTRRFVVGHTRHNDGKVTVARPWALPRNGNPAGGMSSTVGDLVRWARFHLGDGCAADGARVLSGELLRLMQQPTAESPGNAVGDAVGISWWLRDVDGLRLVSHGGNTIGQDSDFFMAPQRDFAVVTLANSSPNGSELNQELGKWALQACLGVEDRDPEPAELGEADLRPYTGRFETIAATVDITIRDGRLLATPEIKPEVLAKLMEAGEEEPDATSVVIGLLPGPGDRYIVTEGPAKGMRGYFARSPSGDIVGVHLGGRLASRVGAVAVVG